MDLSVIVSTFNRADDLARLIDSLLSQKGTEKTSWEIVISNNGSTDKTAEIVENACNRSSIPIQYVHQPRNAKSYGLNAAMRASSGKYLAFTDDDIIAPEGWLENILTYFSDNPGASCIGGPVLLYNENDQEVSVRSSTTTGIYGKEDFNPVFMPIIGCNMILTRTLADSVGFYDVLMGPGSYIGSGDDLDYVYRVLDRGGAIHYVPEIHVYHNHGRSSADDVSKVKRRYMIGRGAFYSKYSFRDRMVLRWAYWEISSLLRRNWYLWVSSVNAREKLSYFFWMLRGMVKWQTRFISK